MPPKADSNSSRKRAYHPKSRTGCWSCRSRKVKCDEGKPGCQRCKNYGMRCAGYSSVRPMFSAYRSLIESQTHDKICKAPSIPLMSSILQEQYFNLFCTKTINAILPYFGLNKWETTWRNVIMDGCSTEPALLHSLVALGALEKTCEVTRIDRNAPPCISPHHEFALKEYGKAIKKLRKGAENDHQNLRIVLLTTIFIICFEELHGNYESSTTQTQIVLKLIEDWKEKYDAEDKHDPGFSSPAPYEIPDGILQVFGRLEIQTMLFVDPRPMETHTRLMRTGEKHIKSMPQVFTSAEEARTYLNLIIRRLMHWIAQMAQEDPEESEEDANFGAPAGQTTNTLTPSSKVSGPPSLLQSSKRVLNAAAQAELELSQNALDYSECSAEPRHILQLPFRTAVPPQVKPPRQPFTDDNSLFLTPAFFVGPILSNAIYQEQAGYLAELSAWWTSFERLYASSKDISNPDIVGLWLLRLHYLLNYITVETKLARTELSYDLYTSEFREALSLCSSILSKLNSETQTGQSCMRFAFDHGVLMPLYVIVTRCRVSSVRHEALRLTQMNIRREGNWDSELTAATAGWIMRAEEAAALENGFVPEKARISHMTVKTHLEDRRALISCWQWSEADQKSMIVVDTITW